MASSCLIVANQTLGGAALDWSIRDCLRRDIRRFHVLVPMTRVEHESAAWSGGFPLGDAGWIPDDAYATAMEEEARRYEARLAEARGRAQHRLDLMLAKLSTLGGVAEGEVGGEDPFEATKAVLGERGPFDEIIVSTLPAGLSRWVKMDLPNRIARLADVPVTTVEAEV